MVFCGGKSGRDYVSSVVVVVIDLEDCGRKSCWTFACRKVELEADVGLANAFAAERFQ